MADITASMVKELRELTGAGMMDCKKALSETNGNMDEAIEFFENANIEFVQFIGRVLILYKHSDNAKNPIVVPKKQ